MTYRFHAGWIQGGLKQAEKGLISEEIEIFKFLADTAMANRFAYPLENGDIISCSNYTVFHGKEGHADTDDESQKRVLLRIWLGLPDVRPFADEGRIWYDVVRHGKMSAHPPTCPRATI